MTNQQKQHLLAYLGYYTMAVDGIWGKGSEAATRRFQGDYGLTADGIFGGETQAKIKTVIANGEKPVDLWKSVPNFTKEEFRCKCGGKYCSGFPAEPEGSLVRLCQQVRSHFGLPMLITSGVRCATHNRNVGGVPGSRHLYGKAVDFCVQGRSAQEALSYAQSLPQVNYAYAIDSTYVHMDVQ